MERSYQSFRALPRANIQFGTSGGVGGEGPESRHFLNLTVQPTTNPYGDPVGEPIDITLALTPRQMAQIVRHFFADIILWSGIYEGLLRRLLTKRWALMTSPVFKTPKLGGEDFKEMHYHRALPEPTVEDMDMLAQMLRLFVDREVRITHTERGIITIEGICKTVHPTGVDTFDIELEDGRRIGIVPESITEDSVEGELRISSRGRRKIQVI